MPGFSKLNSIGITRDADDKTGEDIFNNVVNQIKTHGHLSAPSVFAEFTNGTPRVGIFIIPGRNKTGALEDMLWESLTDNAYIECIESFLACAGQKRSDESQYKDKDILKSKIYAWLAVQGRPSLRIGEAAQKNALILTILFLIHCVVLF